MKLVDWGGALVLGVAQIDEHHEKLVEILNDCFRALMLNDHRRELEEIVKELHEYTCYHFRAEERLMGELGYPEAALHGEAHAAFVSSIEQFQQRLRASESFVAVDVLTFLKEWLVAHILRADGALAAFVKERAHA